MITKESMTEHIRAKVKFVYPDLPDLDGDLVANREKFITDAIALFAANFDERGWPKEMPVFTMVFSGEKSKADPLGQFGYAGYHAKYPRGEESALWKWVDRKGFEK